MCNCLTIKILFNITEVARLWIRDEGVNVLCPILWNSVGENTACLWRSFSCLSALTSNLTATPQQCTSVLSAGEHSDVALKRHIFEMFAHLLQSSPRGLFHVNSGPYHVVERGQEVMTDVKGKLLNGLHLSDGILWHLNGNRVGLLSKWTRRESSFNIMSTKLWQSHEWNSSLSDLTPLSLARAWTVFFMVSVGIMSELSPCK